jgi:hypothetical protein
MEITKETVTELWKETDWETLMGTEKGFSKVPDLDKQSVGASREYCLA